MAKSPISWLLVNADRSRDHDNADSTVQCNGYERDGNRSASIRITCQGRFIYASMSESEVAQLLPTILRFSEREARNKAVTEFLAELSDSEALILLSEALNEKRKHSGSNG